jgi:TetR/AcrR family transcriptional regulator, mexJK operon transcriptional repressor
MEHPGETRWVRKHQAIVEAATRLFLSKGYFGTSMDDIAAAAAVSKQTVYKHFAEKDQLFAEIIVATTDRVDAVVRMVAASLEDSADLERGLCELARTLLITLMEPDLLRLRRLVIATADQFPELGSSWYENGFGRVLAALAERFQQLTAKGPLRAEDPLLAANHFVGLLLWIPVNRAMFTGDHSSTKADLEHYADQAARTFLAAYARSGSPRPKRGRTPASTTGRA